jgi:hypothetical protein
MGKKMIIYYAAWGMSGVLLLNLIVSAITKNKKLIILPKSKLGKMITQIYYVLTVIWSVLYLIKKIDSLWFLVAIVGGQIVLQMYTAIKKLIPKRVHSITAFGGLE